MKSKAELLDIFFNKMYHYILVEYSYKGINLGGLSTRFFAGYFLNDKTIINCIDKGNVDFLVSKYSSKNKLNGLLSSLKGCFVDLARVVYYTFKSNHVKAEIYFFISNPKFIKFLEPIRVKLENHSIKYAYIFWDKNDISSNFKHNKVILRHVFSSFTHKINKPKYFLFGGVDRFINTAKKIKGSKVIIPEGCLPSMHIIGELGKVYNYQTICLQWGFYGRSATKVGWRDMPYDKFLVWGEFFKKQFEKYNSLNIVSAGHSNLKLSNSLFSKSYILFAVQKELGDHISLKDVEFFLKNVYEIAKSLPSEKFVLRTHPDLPFDMLPLKPSNDIKNLVIHDYNLHSLNDSLKEAKICVGISSTTVIESVALNCYPVYVKSNALPLQIHDIFGEMSNLQHVFEFSELVKFINNFNYSQVLPEILNLKKDFFSKNIIIEEILK